MTRRAAWISIVLATSAEAQPTVRTRPEPTVGEIVVTARPGPPRTLPEPIDHFRRHCFDAARLYGSPAPPEDDPEWTPLDDEARRKFGVTDPAAPAYGLHDDRRDQALALKIERLHGPWRTVEHRCTLVVIGGRELASLRDGVSALMRAAGTVRHVGAAGGAERLPGWRQWLWSGMPSRRSKNWSALRRDGGRGSESAWLRVVEPEFFDEYDYILADMKLKDDAERPVAVLTFAYTRRPKTRAAVADGSGLNEKGGPEGPPRRRVIRSGRDQKSR